MCKALIELGWTPPADLDRVPQAKDAPYQRRVVCAANRYHQQFIGYTLILGARHFDQTMHRQKIARDWDERSCPDSDQGFIDQHGVFMTREEAWDVAVAAGQIIRRVGGDGERLYSENLY